MAAASPEELETLLEDALLLQDAQAVAALFVNGHLLVTEGGRVRERREAADLLLRHEFLARPRSVTVARDVALVVGEHTVNVSCRGVDGAWRLVATVLSLL